MKKLLTILLVTTLFISCKKDEPLVDCKCGIITNKTLYVYTLSGNGGNIIGKELTLRIKNNCSDKVWVIKEKFPIPPGGNIPDINVVDNYPNVDEQWCDVNPW